MTALSECANALRESQAYQIIWFFLANGQSWGNIWSLRFVINKGKWKPEARWWRKQNHFLFSLFAWKGFLSLLKPRVKPTDKYVLPNTGETNTYFRRPFDEQLLLLHLDVCRNKELPIVCPLRIQDTVTEYKHF